MENSKINIIWLLPSEGWEFRGEGRHTNQHVWCMLSHFSRVQLFAPLWTLCAPMDCSLPSSSVPGISQARILEWVAISFSRGTSPPKDRLTSPASPALQVDSLPLSHQESQHGSQIWYVFKENVNKELEEGKFLPVRCLKRAGGSFSHPIRQRCPSRGKEAPEEKVWSRTGNPTCRGSWLERWEEDCKVRKEMEIRTYWGFLIYIYIYIS